MKLRNPFFYIIFAIFLAGPPMVKGQQAQMSADEVLTLVRFSHTQYNRDFSGQMRMSLTKTVPFILSLKPDSIRYIFNDPSQIIYLDTANNRFALFEGIGGKQMTPVDPSKYGKPIRETDVTYEDLSMRFLYWPGARIIEEPKLKNRDTWRVRMANPDGKGDYAAVECWIDKDSGGLMKMEGLNRNNQIIRRFEVLHGKKFDDVWMVDQMRIETINPTSGRPLSSTRMQIQETVN